MNIKLDTVHISYALLLFSIFIIQLPLYNFVSKIRETVVQHQVESNSISNSVVYQITVWFAVYFFLSWNSYLQLVNLIVPAILFILYGKYISLPM